MSAVDESAVAKIVGYKVKPGDFNLVTPNLPQHIAILAESTDAASGQFTENEPIEFTSAQEVGELLGYGSPAYHVMRVLRPLSGSGVGSVKTTIFPQDPTNTSSSTAKQVNVEPTGTATRNKTHTLVINDRRGVDGGRYDFTINEGDTAANVASKMVDTVNNVLASPADAEVDTNETTSESALLTAKWSGLTSDDLIAEVDTNGDSAGMTYAVSEPTAGAGTPDIQAALDKYQDNWYTITVNTYGEPHWSTLEKHNGIPDEDNPTGRYSPTVYKPYFSLFGDTSGNAQHDFSTHKNEVTNVVCVAPNSSYFPFEVAASYAALLGPQAQNRPHLDISGQFLPDLEAPNDIGDYSSYTNRDAFVKRGYSTVVRNGGKYEVADFVTTYHPDGEVPPAYRYVRDLVIDFNVRFSYYLLERTYVRDKAIAANGDPVDAFDVIKPKDWKQVLNRAADNWASRALIADPGFTKENTTVQISETNPNRLDTLFKYKRSGYHRIGSTIAVAGFNFGS